MNPPSTQGNRVSVLRALVHGLTTGSRTLRRRPVVTAMAALVLALGIGASTAVFSIVNGVMLQPLPYRDPSRLVAIWDRDTKATGVSKNFDSYDDFREVRDHARAFSRVAAATWAVRSRVLSGHGAAKNVLAMPVSEAFFPLLGVAPERGRTFTAEDAHGGCSAVLSDALWRGSLGADPTLIGRQVVLDDQPCTVLGVMPSGFAFYPQATALWVIITATFVPTPDSLPIGIFARLKPDVSVSDAQAEVASLHAAVHRADGKERGLVPVVYGLHEEFTFLAEADLRPTLWLLLGAVGFVLLIGCFDVATLLLAQARARERELAVRVALGCDRGQMIGQLLAEALTLALLGGTAGVALAFAAVGWFRAINPVEMPVGSRVAISIPVLVFALLLSCATALVCGVLPAWKASRLDPIQSLKAGSRGSIVTTQRLVRGLIAGELAASLVLLAGASLLIQSVLKMSDESLGFDPAGLSIGNVQLPASHYRDAAARLRVYDALISRLGSRATIAASLPPYGPGLTTRLQVRGRTLASESDGYDVGECTVDAGYFDLLGIVVLRGRTFDRHDLASSEPVAVINETVARDQFPGMDPVGQSIRVGDQSNANPWRRIVGVVADEKTSSAYHEMGWVERPEVFEPLAQDPPASASVAIRGPTSELSRALTDLDHAIAVGDIETMQGRLGQSLAYPRFRAILLGAFAAFALLLAGVGLYGVLRQFVAQRTREIGLRMAIGASAGDVARLVGVQASRPVAAGLVVGLSAATVLGRSLASLFYRVRPVDPVTLVLVCMTLIGVAALATVLPTRRATRVDPMVALRNE